MIVGRRQRAYELVNSSMHGGEPTDRECHDYPSFITGFESHRKCLVCDKDLFKKFCETEEGKTSVLNCSVWNTLCWIVWPLRWPRSSRHTTCCPKCSLTNSVLVKFRVLSGLMCHQGLDSPEGYGLKYFLDTGDFVVKTLTNTLWYIYIILRKGF